jgi:hypothetical protein
MLYRGTFEGGCFCHAVRYRFVDVFDCGYCYCSICRRMSGAPVITWVNTPSRGFAVIKGSVRFVRSSERYRRSFCVECGTQMWTESIEPKDWDLVSVHHGTIDRAAEIEPAVHLCFADRLPWLRIDDQLPKVEGNKLPHPSKRDDPRWKD